MNSVDIQILGNRSVGECLAARPGSPAAFVMCWERALLCGRFVQCVGGVGCNCDVCQHFSYRDRWMVGVDKVRVRGGVFKRSGWY